MRKEGQRSTGGKAPKKRFVWPPRAVTRELADVNARSVNTQTENPGTSTAQSQTWPSTSDQQNQTAAESRNQGSQSDWQYTILQNNSDNRFNLCYNENCRNNRENSKN